MIVNVESDLPGLNFELPLQFANLSPFAVETFRRVSTLFLLPFQLLVLSKERITLFPNLTYTVVDRVTRVDVVTTTDWCNPALLPFPNLFLVIALVSLELLAMVTLLGDELSYERTRDLFVLALKALT